MTRGIIVIHGIGEQREGDFLKEIVNPLAGYLESKGGKVDFTPEIALGFPSGTPGPAQLTLTVHGPGDALVEEWRVREAYWAAAFRPPSLREMFRWGRALIARETQAIARIFDDPLNENPDDACGAERRAATGGAARPPAPAPEPYPPRTERFYRDQALVLKGVAWLVEKAGHGLLTLVWLLLLLRGLPGPPAVLRRFQLVAQVVSWLTRGVNALANALYPFVVQGLGDAKVFLDNPMAADAIRRSFEDAVLEMLQDNDIESITIIAHSLGAMVSYDAMTEGRPIDAYLRAYPQRRKVAGSERYRRITWVTVGAALNRSYTMTEQEAASHARERFRSAVAATLRTPEPAFFWLNLYARYDPVPAGPIEPAFHRCTQVTCAQFKERLVINTDNLLSDHTSYWKNDTLVWPRIVRAIYDGEYPWPRTELREPENQRLIRERTIGIADRNRRLLQHLGVLLLLGGVAVVALAVAGLVVAGAIYLVWKAYSLVSWLAFLVVEGAVTGLRRLFQRR